MTSIKIDNRQVLGALNQLVSKAKNLRPAFAEIGEDLINTIKRGFSSATRPDAKAWAAKTRQPPLRPMWLCTAAVGNLVGSLTKVGSFMEGQPAKLMCQALHEQHQLTLGGVRKTVSTKPSGMIDRTHRPRIKLH